MRILPRSPLARTALALALVSLFLAGSQWVLNTTASEPTPSEAIPLAAAYLVTHTNTDGSFAYEYDPETNTTSDSYNILRHAGTIYSMLEAYEVTKEPETLSAAERAIRYLVAKAAPCPTVSDALCIVEGGAIKLGGNGLALLALAKHRQLSGSDEFAETSLKIARYIVGTQSNEGEFVAHKIDVQSGAVDPFKSEYYPGEALFALARLSTTDDNRQWMEAAHTGALWLITVRDAGKDVSELPHDHWLLYALNELHADRADPVYLEHAKKITDAIVALQHRTRTGEEADWNGGYYEPPRSTPTATRSEGLSAAYQMFIRAGDSSYAEKAFDALERGIAFQMRTFITRDDVRTRKMHIKGAGGFCESLEECTVRIDYVQHNLSALIAYETIRSERGEGVSPVITQ